MDPTIQETDPLLHLCYNLPCRVHTAKVYPLAAPNGSALILLGHENGLRILWRGGQPRKNQIKKQIWRDDGTLEPDVAVDRDDDPDSSTSDGERTEVHVEKDNTTTPFDPIIQFVDLVFGIAVLHIAFPYLPTDAAQQHHSSYPKVISQKLVVAAVCSDSSVRLATIPLGPPSASDKRKAEAAGKICFADGRVGSYGEQLVEISNASIQFNPSLPYDKRNSTLLVAEAKGPVRIFDCLSTETSSQCSWRMSLFPSLDSITSPRGARSKLLDAQWVLGGRAILALFADGEWGIWDLEYAGHKPQSGTQAPQVPMMGSFATFAVTGWVHTGPNVYKANNADRTIRDGGKAAKLAPTTPGTRRSRQENLFSGPVGQNEGPAHGGISVIPSQDTKPNNEAVLLWHNDSIVVIPSLRTHWANKAKCFGNLFGTGAKGEAKVISNISLESEWRNDVCLLPSNHKSSSTNPINVLVVGDSRFVIIAPPLSKQHIDPRAPYKPPSDQSLLDNGSLDLDEMDRVLANMNGRTQTSTSYMNGGPSKRKVGFLDM
ncbi:MAG: hypothetical protein Q9181_003554 [Wetmoreana brouardii]